MLAIHVFGTYTFVCAYYSQEDYMRLGLIAARLARNWSQQGVADSIGKDRSSIAHYEKGDCDIPGEVLRQLSQLFGVSMDALHVNYDITPASVGAEGD